VPTPISAPATGLLVWNSNPDIAGGNGIGFYFWNVYKWEKLANSNNLWIPDVNGIHSSVLHVGIGVDAHNIYPFIVRQPNMGGGGFGIAHFESDDTWHAAVSIKNNSSNKQFTMIVGGTTNVELFPGNFGLNNGGTKWTYVVNGATNYVGFNPPSIVSSIPKSTIHVFQGDVNIEQIGSGIILKSPNGTCWRVTIDNDGNFVRTAITCP
jgi:hypothetical protein